MVRGIRMVVLAVALAGMPSQAIGQGAASPPQNLPKSYLEAIRAPLQHRLRETNVVRAQIEIGKRRDGSPLVIHLTRPEAAQSKPLPVVLLLHGGLPDEAPIRPSAWQVYRDWAAALAGRGNATIMLDHSLSFPVRRLDQALAELDAVLRWLARDGTGKGLDNSGLSAMSFSAGGLLLPEMLAEVRPLAVRRFVLFYPLLGIGPDDPGAGQTDAASAARMDSRAAVERIARRATPLLIIRSGKDEVPGLLGVLDPAIAALLAADAAVEIVNVPGAPHSIDFKADVPAAPAAIERALNFLSQPTG